MLSRDYKTLKQFWKQNNIGNFVFITKPELQGFITNHSLADLLSKRELFWFEKIDYSKRRDDWLLGRYATKLLVARFWEELNNEQITLSGIELIPRNKDKPVVILKRSFALEYDTSLSHTDECAVAAVATSRTTKIGIDIEKIKTFHSPVLSYFLSEKEIKQKANYSCSTDAFYTTLWTLKEAALKALRIGINGSFKETEVSMSSLADATIRVAKKQVSGPNKLLSPHAIGLVSEISHYTVGTVLFSKR